MAGVSESVLERMKSKARGIKEKQAAAQSGQKFPRWDLVGKNTIVAPGHDIISRFLPRWDFAQKYSRGADGKIALNPKYVDDLIFFEAIEHWWDVDDGKGGTRRQSGWCLKIFDPEALCPVCEASEELIADNNPDSRKYGKDVKGKEVFLFNAVVGGAGKRRMTDAGLPDIRVMSLQETLLVQLSALMTGGDAEEGEENFARGDVSDIREGYNCKLTRPATQGDRWKLDCSPKPSPLYTAEEKEQWKTWVSLLVDIPEVVRSEMKSYDDLYRQFHGVAPEDMKAVEQAGKGPAAPVKKSTALAVEADEFGAPDPDAPGDAAEETPDMGFELPAEPTKAPVPGKKPAPKK